MPLKGLFSKLQAATPRPGAPHRKLTTPRQQPLLTKITHTADRLAFNWEVREALYRHLSAQISNGVATEVALDMFRARLQRRQRLSADQIVAKISRSMRNGSTFTQALSPWIPEDELAIIYGGEMSGHLPKSFALVIEAKRRLDRVMKALKSSLVSPALYIGAVYAMLWAIGRFVIPSLQLALPKEKAQGLVYGLYVTGEFANSLWVLLPPAIVGGVVFAIVHSLSRWTGPGRIKAEHYFPYSFYRDLNGYTWLMSFSALLRAGMVDIEILKRQISQASPWLKERLQSLRFRMENGDSLSQALLAPSKKNMPAFGFPNPDIVDDISSLHGFPEFSEKIAVVASQWAQDLEAATLARAKSIGFWIEMVMYGVMGLLMVAVNSMTEQIGSIPPGLL